MRNLACIFVAVCQSVMLAACADDESPIYCLDTIDSGDDASVLTENLIRSIRREIQYLPAGNHENVVIPGARGTMTINGYVCIYECFYGGGPSIDITVSMDGYANYPQIRNDINGDVYFVYSDYLLQMTDIGTQINYTIDDPYIYPDQGFYFCGHSFEDIDDTINSWSATMYSEDFWDICTYPYCGPLDEPMILEDPDGYIETSEGVFFFTGSIGGNDDPQDEVVSRASDFVGEWINEDSETMGTTRFVITISGETVTIQGYGACSPSECVWDPFTITVAEIKSVRFTTTWELGWSTQTFHYELLSESRMFVTTFIDFHDGRSDMTLEEYFSLK